MTRSRLDRKASAKEAVAKGSTGDGMVKAILQSLGWRQVVRLSRTNPGCDLVAVCGCPDKHLLWVEVKTYPSGRIETDSWDHLIAFAREVSVRQRERFALFTYQAARGGARRKGEALGRSWWASTYPGLGAPNHRPFIKHKSVFQPPCDPPLPKGMVSNPPALDNGPLPCCGRCPFCGCSGCHYDHRGQHAESGAALSLRRGEGEATASGGAPRAAPPAKPACPPHTWGGDGAHCIRCGFPRAGFRQLWEREAP